MSMQRFIQIDQEGNVMSHELRVQDEDYGRAILDNLRCENRTFVTTYNNEKIIVEAFDEPLVARGFKLLNAEQAAIELPYALTKTVTLDSFRVDVWDRFHGLTLDNVPFVLSRQAQMELFNLVDKFDDTSITVKGRKIPIDPLEGGDKQADTEEFWEKKYQDWDQKNEKPGWEKGQPAVPLRSIVSQIKMPKSRILVAGAGTSQDAAFLASLGHLVTAIDISPLAIAKAKEKFSDVSNLKFVAGDFFKYAKENAGQYDLIFEHAFFCAIHPTRRQEVIKAWKSLLTPQGQLLGIFFAMDRAGGPPFGSSEWELRERLKIDFEFLYWTRWRQSLPERLGRELVVLARRK